MYKLYLEKYELENCLLKMSDQKAIKVGWKTHLNTTEPEKLVCQRIFRFSSVGYP